MAWTKRQPISQSAPLLPRYGSIDRRMEADGEDGEARVVDLHPAEHVAQPAQRHDEDRLHEAVAHDHPEQEGDVAGSQGVEVDAPEDGGQGDDHDRAVEHGHEGGGRRVGQGGPLVAVVEPGRLSRAVRYVLRSLRRSPSLPTPPSDALGQPLDQRCGDVELLEFGTCEVARQRLRQQFAPRAAGGARATPGPRGSARGWRAGRRRDRLGGPPDLAPRERRPSPPSTGG